MAEGGAFPPSLSIFSPSFFFLFLFTLSFPLLSSSSPASEHGWPYTTSFSSPKELKIYVYPYRPTYEERIEHMKNPITEKFDAFSSPSSSSSSSSSSFSSFFSSSSSSSSSSRWKQHHTFSPSTLSESYPALRNFSQLFDKSLISRPFNFRGQAFGLGVEYRIASAIINSQFVTQNPDEADLFFIHYAPHRGDHTHDGRIVQKMLAESPYFDPEVSNHFFVHNLPWYNLWPAPPATHSLISISPERFNSKPMTHVTVPYSDDGWGTDLRTWEMEDIQHKKYLSCFVGSLSRVKPGQAQRRILREQFHACNQKGGKGGAKEVLWSEFDKRTITYNYSEQMITLRQCRFCPIPLGDSASSKRLFDAIQADCIPVVTSDGFIFPYEDIIPYEDFLYVIPESELMEKSKFNFIDFLRSIPEEEEKQKRKRLREEKHHFIFNDPFIYPGDATDLLMRELSLRAQLLRGRKRVLQLEVEKRKKAKLHHKSFFEILEEKREKLAKS